MKNSELLFGVLGEIDPATVEAACPEKNSAAGNTPDKAGGPKKRLIRPALFAAAVLSIVLLATAAVAGVMAGRMRVRTYTKEENVENGETYNDIYRMVIDDWAGYAILPEEVMDTLREHRISSPDNEKENGYNDDSRSARERAAAGEMLLFDSWDSAAAWLNCGLLSHSWPLSEYMQDGVKVWYIDGEYKNIRNIGILGQFATPDFRFNLQAFIPLNEEAVGIYNGGRGEYKAYGFPEVETEEWISAQGFETTIVTTNADIRGWWESDAHFIYNGVIYKVFLSDPDFDTAVSRVKEIVDSLS